MVQYLGNTIPRVFSRAVDFAIEIRSLAVQPFGAQRVRRPAPAYGIQPTNLTLRLFRYSAQTKILHCVLGPSLASLWASQGAGEIHYHAKINRLTAVGSVQAV